MAIGGDLLPALNALREGGAAASSLIREIEAQVEQLDEGYFAQVDAAGSDEIPTEALVWFSRARAASALAFGLAARFDEAIYESINAVVDPQPLIHAVQGELSQS